MLRIRAARGCAAILGCCALLLAGACSRAAAPALGPEPAAEEGGVVFSADAVRTLAHELAADAQRSRVGELSRGSLTHQRLWDVLGPLLAPAAGIRREEIGLSVQHRPIYALRFGRGPVRVLLWSQMHGDEPTATLALADLFRFIAENPESPRVQRLGEALTVVAIPMLNPDGAQRSRRENAAGIDINRDARRQRSPEARVLAAAHARLSPQFAFNLHDQARRVTADGTPVAISLLAPASDANQSVGAVRARARQIAAVMRIAAEALVGGGVTRYDDTYVPDAFGDSMQSWGTSTVLLETGAWPGDPDKEYLRRVNFALLLTALDAIATGAYEAVDVTGYESLPANPPPAGW